jgi:hypothetical protein
MTADKVLVPSQLAFDSCLEFFSSPASNLGITDMKVLKYKPLNAFDSNSAIRFHVPNVGSSYIYLPDTRLEVTARILQANDEQLPPMPELPKEGETLSDAEKKIWDIASVGPVNAWIHSLWDQVEVSANDTLISTGTTAYSYKALMNLLLNTSDSTKLSLLQSHMFYADSPGYMDSLNIASTGSNMGLIQRAQYTARSKPVTMLANIFADIFSIQKYLLNGVSLSVNLFPTTTAFRLMSGNDNPNYKIELLDVSLLITHAIPAPQVLVAHQEVLKSNTTAKYFFVQQELRRFIISKGNTSFFAENVFNGSCPDKVVLAMVGSDSCSGSFTSNPYNFKHYDLSFVNITTNGVPSPRGAAKIDLENGKFGPYFEELFRFANPLGGDSMSANNGITKRAFANGYSLFVVDLALQSKMGNFYPLKRESSVRMELTFAKPLPETVILFALVYTPNMFSVDFARNVFLGPS